LPFYFFLDLEPYSVFWEFSYEQFTSEFFRFITPAISTDEKSNKMEAKDFEPFGFFLTTPALPGK
jgi:TetR/AcrR family transcriptional regulator